MAGEDAGGGGRQRRIDIDRDLGQRLLGHQLAQVADQLLGPLDREGRDQERALRAHRRLHLGAQLATPVGGGSVLPVGVAIGALADQIVDAAGAFRVRVHQLVVRTDIAGKQQFHRGFGEVQLDRGGAEQVAGVPETGAQAGQDLEPVAIGKGVEKRERRLRIRAGIDRLDRVAAAAPAVAPVELLDLDLLDVGAVGQHDAAQLERRAGGVDRPGIAVADQLRQQAGMVDMGMAEHDRVDVADGKGEGPVVQLLLGLGALEHAAVEQDGAARRLETMTRPGDAAGGAMECQPG